MSFSSMLFDYTRQELFDLALSYGIVEADESADDHTSEQLVAWIREWSEEQAAMDHYAGFYSY